MQKITTDINLAINSLKIGKLVAIPTETVYGLAGDALNEKAVEQIFILKKRPKKFRPFHQSYFRDFFLYRAVPFANFAKSAAKAEQSVFSSGSDPNGFALTKAAASAVN